MIKLVIAGVDKSIPLHSPALEHSVLITFLLTKSLTSCHLKGHFFYLMD